MRPFAFERPEGLEAAIRSLAAGGAQALAGGTTLVDLMKLDVLRPERVVDISRLDLGGVERREGRLRLGALTPMSVAAEHPELQPYAAVVESLWKAASPQLRHAATLGGNLLQRTRCPYFRDTGAPCNRRAPGSGCSAQRGYHRLHAVLGTSQACIASYPGDLAVALAAFGAEIEVAGPDGRRTLPVTDLHALPGDAPHEETSLRPGELVTAILLPPEPPASVFVKVRDRESYAFANASAAVVLELDGETVRRVGIGLGGLATKPWRSRAAEDALLNGPLAEDTARAAADAAFAEAHAGRDNAFKVPLGKAVLVEALMRAKGRAA
jgi:xanthine dehydrogenase YagS FAD-binding subunit